MGYPRILKYSCGHWRTSVVKREEMGGTKHRVEKCPKCRNEKPKSKPCPGCSYPIALDAELCGECACEDDSE